MNKIYYIIVFISMAFIACEDIFEKNIEDETVVIVSPQDNYQTESVTHTFWWEEVDGALKYHLQIVSPSFDNVQYLVLDTNLTKTMFQQTLSPGDFQWRVKAYNGSSETEYTTYTIRIDSTADLSSQQIVLISPSNNTATNVPEQTFSWYEIYNADDYRFEIHSTDWDGELAYNPEIIEGNTLSMSLSDGFYVWGVQAQNSISASAFTTRSIIIDTEVPNQPTLITPAYNTTFSDSLIAFEWERGANSGSSIKDSLYIASDSLFNNIEIAVYISDTIYSWTATQTGTYYWKVRSFDLAGNISVYSEKSMFKYE